MIEKDFFQLIINSLLKVSKIQDCVVKPSIASEEEIHFSELHQLNDEQVKSFVKKCIMVCGLDNKLIYYQIKKQGCKLGFCGVDVPLIFDNPEQREKYLEYRNQLLA